MATSRICSIPNCGKPHLARGYCKSHYNRLKLYGDPLGGQPLNGSGMAWLLDHAGHPEEDECLIWPFARVSAGYGSLNFSGRSIDAHRLMCMLVNGQPIERNMEAAHSCGKGRLGCVNPRHLSWKTRASNEYDKIAHGTAPRGQNCGKAILTDEDIRKIRSLGGSLTQREIGERFGVGAQAIGKILNGKRWSHTPNVPI